MMLLNAILQKQSLQSSFKLLQILVIDFRHYNLIEQSKEKMGRSIKGKIHESPEESSSPSNAESLKIKKKSRDKHHKKKSRAILHTTVNQTSLIQAFQDKSSIFFEQKLHELKKRYSQQYKNTVHIREIMSKSQGTVYHVKQDDCQQETLKYFHNLKNISQSNYQKIGLASNQSKLSLQILRNNLPQEDKKVTLKDLKFLPYSEAQLYHRRVPIKTQVKDFVHHTAQQLGYSNIQLQQIDAQILLLCRIHNQQMNTIRERINTTLKKQDHLFGCFNQDHSESEKLQNLYMRALVIKNLEKSFNQSPIDFYNYHKTIENYEDKGYLQVDFERITTFLHFKKYISSKKPRLNKSPKYNLRTPCSACFSDFSEMSNPIQKCPQCPMRVHKYCQKVDKRCHRCRFGRTSNDQKSQTGFCYICQRPREKGLMIRTVTNRSPHHYAHNFCLFIHNFWKVEDKDIKGEYIQPKQHHSTCIVCDKSSGCFLDCHNCKRKVHGMCAYLQGWSFMMRKHRENDSQSYDIQVNCCKKIEEKKRLSFQRRFKLNYEKVIFRQNKELYEYIQQVMNRP